MNSKIRIEMEHKIDLFVDEIFAYQQLDYKNSKLYKNILVKVDNVPDGFRLTRKEILESIDEYVVDINKNNISRDKNVLKHLIMEYLKLL